MSVKQRALNIELSKKANSCISDMSAIEKEASAAIPILQSAASTAVAAAGVDR